jgi:uncharacterized membrane protein/mono/diheme cytochrome c family protein
MHPFLMQPIKVLQIGLLHPLIVHLPIGILFFVLVLSFLPQTLRNSLQKVVQIALLAGSVSAMSASITGYLLSRSGDYDLSMIEQHQWSGILTSIFLLLAWLIKKYQRYLLWISLVFLTVTGHLGGELTHGENYLGPILKTNPPPSVEQTSDLINSVNPARDRTDSVQPTAKFSPYQNNVAPLLEANCYSCHSSKKKKGGLRLDSEKWIKAGGKNGFVLSSGNPEKSTLYTHLRLPLDDEKHMPPKGKKQLNNGQINTIFQWISMGAPFGEVESNEAKESSMMARTEITPIIETENQEISIQKVEPLAPLKAADSSIIQSLLLQEVVIKPVVNRENGLYVSLINTKKITPEIMNMLSALKHQVIELKINETMITDESIQFLAGFKQLEELHLTQTNIGDDAIMHIKDLPELQYLNLYGTRVTDQSLHQLNQLKKIKKVNLWNTGISEKEIQRFNKNYPQINLEYGQLRLNNEDTLQKQ